jgi:hypothetical protein
MCKAFERKVHNSLPTSSEVKNVCRLSWLLPHTLHLLGAHRENSNFLGKPSSSQHYRLAAVFASPRQLLFHSTHFVCFTATVAVPLYTLRVLHCDNCCFMLHTVCASLRQFLFHSTHCVCFSATVAVPLYTLCVLHCDSCCSTLHTVCAAQLLFPFRAVKERSKITVSWYLLHLSTTAELRGVWRTSGKKKMARKSIEVKPFLNESTSNLRVIIHTVIHAKYIFLRLFVPASDIRNKVNSIILTTKKVVNPRLVCVFYFLLKVDYKLQCPKFWCLANVEL